MTDDTENQRIAGAHTRSDLEPEPEKSARVGDQTAVAQAALDDLASQIQPEADPSPPDLFDEEQCLFKSPVKHVAEVLDTPKGRGRRKGSKNKANQNFRNYLAARGTRHPGLVLADIASASPEQLAKELGCTKKEAMDLIISASDKLLPYVESKRPVEVDVKEHQLFQVVIDNTGFSDLPPEDGFMSMTGKVLDNPDKSDT